MLQNRVREKFRTKIIQTSTPSEHSDLLLSLLGVTLKHRKDEELQAQMKDELVRLKIIEASCTKIPIPKYWTNDSRYEKTLRSELFEYHRDGAVYVLGWLIYSFFS